MPRKRWGVQLPVVPSMLQFALGLLNAVSKRVVFVTIMLPCTGGHPPAIKASDRRVSSIPSASRKSADTVLPEGPLVQSALRSPCTPLLLLSLILWRRGYWLSIPRLFCVLWLPLPPALEVHTLHQDNVREQAALRATQALQPTAPTSAPANPSQPASVLDIHFPLHSPGTIAKVTHLASRRLSPNHLLRVAPPPLSLLQLCPHPRPLQLFSVPIHLRLPTLMLPRTTARHAQRRLRLCPKVTH